MGLSRLFTAFIVVAFASLSHPATVSAELSDDPLDFSEFEPAADQHAGTDPNVSRLFFMPTFETMPQGQANVGTIELLSVHGSFSPLNFVQIGGAIIPWAPGIASVGAKLRLWRSNDHRLGVAVGGHYASLNWDRMRTSSEALTTGYLVAGYTDVRRQIQGGLFLMGSRTKRFTGYAPPPEPDLSYQYIKRDQHVFGALGFSAHIQGRTFAMMEVWGIGVNDTWPVFLPGFRFFEDNTSFQAIITPIWIGDGEFRFGFPIFDITHHFR